MGKLRIGDLQFCPYCGNETIWRRRGSPEDATEGRVICETCSETFTIIIGR